MKSKVSIQKSFIYGVTAIAVLAVVVGVVLRFSGAFADTPASSNADTVSDCYRGYGKEPNIHCFEKIAAACKRTVSRAIKTAATLTDQEKTTYGETAKAWNININNGNPEGKFRLVMGAKRTSTSDVTRLDYALTPLVRNWGGYGDRIYLIFNDGMGYKKVYNNIELNKAWTSYINRTGLTGDVDVMFVGKNEDGCLEGVIDLPTALVTPTPTPSPSPSIPPLDPDLEDGLKGCYYNGKSFDALLGNRTENVNYIWGKGPALENGSADNFSVRWEGMVVPKYTETYKFKVNYDDAVRLWIGGRQYINDWNNNTTTQTKEASVTLQAGVPVSLRLEYFENTSDASVQLYWSSNSQAEQIIPVADLKHDKNYQCAAGTVTATPVPSPSPSVTPTPSAVVSALASITPDPNWGAGLKQCNYNGNNLDTYVYETTANVNFLLLGQGGLNKTDVDHFSARWEGYLIPLYTEKYKIIVDYDDGARLWLNGQKVIDDWNIGGLRAKQAEIDLVAGVPTPVKLEYFDNIGNASIRLSWESTSQVRQTIPTTQLRNDPGYVCLGKPDTSPVIPSPTPTVGPPTTTPIPAISPNPAVSVDSDQLRPGIRADYFSGTNLSEDKLVKRSLVNRIYFDWRNASPTEGLENYNFSARFSGKVKAPETGLYSIGVTHNDGVSIWLGGKLIVDKWQDWAPCDNLAKCNNNNEVYKTAAQVYLEKDKYYDLKVESYDQGGGAVLKLFWKRPSSEEGTILSPSALFTPYNPNPPAGAGTGLMGSYYAGMEFDQIVLNQKDRKINFDWLNEGPRKTGNDKFSVRWMGEIRPRFSEMYTFTLAANDGVRMWIDDEKVIDEWHQVDSNNLAVYTAKVNLTGGESYPIKIEYFENTGNAGIYLKWKSASENEQYVPANALFPGDPVPIGSVTPTASPSATTTSTTEITKTFEPGYTAIYIPDSEKPQITQALIAKGLGVYKFGPLVYDTSTPPKKTWLTSFDKFNHKIGYYVLNPGTANETVNLSLDSSLENPFDAMVYKGWNFLANSTDNPKKLSELIYEKRICTDSTNQANCDGYSATVNFANLSYGWKGQGKAAYRRIYILDDPRATSQTPEPFTVIDVVNTGIENVQIPTGKMFWFYFFN